MPIPAENVRVNIVSLRSILFPKWSYDALLDWGENNTIWPKELLIGNGIQHGDKGTTKGTKKAKRKTEKSKRREKNRQNARLTNQVSKTQATRLQTRLARQTVQAWDGECAEDRAIFDDESRQSLSPELAAQADVVRKALSDICGGQAELALGPLSIIPRHSPFAAWRLFLRGLVAWRNEDLNAAQRNWSRLDRARRPGRIATTLMLAHRDDLESLSRLDKKPASADDASDATTGRTTSLDSELVYHARIVWRVYVDRIVIRAARSGVRIQDVSDATLGPRRIEWLREFTREYRAIEPDFVQALHEVALQRACCGKYSDLFSDAVQHFTGPRHDRNNCLLTFFFESMEDSPRARKNARQALEKYLTVDLPGNDELSPQLRDALISQAHLNEAMSEAAPRGPLPGGMFSMFDDPPDTDLIAHHFEKSIEAYPQHRLAYESYVDWLESYIDDRLKKAGRDEMAALAADVRLLWVQALPDDIDPRLKLVDYLLENGKSDEARSHVDFLSGVRQDNPLARAMAWKWNVLEAMRLCHRKAWLSEVPQRLNEAEEEWPVWLSQAWLPYLRAAYQLRCGNHDRFQTELLAGRAAGAIEAGSLQDACMTLAATQRMRVPAGELKPLREPIVQALKKLASIDENDLLATADFWWDLSRVNLLYPAYRMHGTKFLRELLGRFDDGPSLVHSQLDQPLIQSALFVMAEQGLFNDGYNVKLPKWADRSSFPLHPTIAACTVMAALNRRVSWRIDNYADHVPVLREAASQADAFYRHWFITLADDLEEAIRVGDSTGLGGFAGPFFRSMGDDENPECDCDNCRAARGEI